MSNQGKGKPGGNGRQPRRGGGASGRGRGAGSQGSGRGAGPSGQSSGGGTRGTGGRHQRRDVTPSGSRERRGSPKGRGGAAQSIVARGAKGNLELPQWVKESLTRVTPKPRVAAALQALERAAEAFVAGQYKKAVARATDAKRLSPREATVRELLGLSAYRTGQWELALRELRTYRRLAGDTSHLPVEMDTLRALNRPAEVEKAWQTLQELGGSPAAMKEGRVVYGSFLIDQGEARKAWDVTRPKKMQADPFEEDLRLWYVAARAAGHLGDFAALEKLRNAIVSADAAFPGMDELDSIGRS